MNFYTVNTRDITDPKHYTVKDSAACTTYRAH